MVDSECPKINVALHVHTLYSPCAETRPRDVEEYCRENKVDVLGVTDHDSISGALELQAVAPGLRVIVGEEIKTRQGEIVGLFLKHEIEPGLDAVETCELIKRQGGLVYVPHPFDPFKINRLKKPVLLELLDMVDIIEVYNAKLITPFFNISARRFAEKHCKVGAAGSDSHYLSAIDICVNEMDDFGTPEEFLRSLAKGRLVTRRSGVLRAWYVGLKNVVVGEGHHVKRFGRR
ncbi:MAG: PHP domain-containing protein [Armatimonadetes bacterium]|nr:PHP domain-containing protein [Armatimonadota bacterium]